MRPRAIFNGTLPPSAESRLRAHLARGAARNSSRFILSHGITVSAASLSPMVCHRIGLDVCISRNMFHSLYLRGMPPLRFHGSVRSDSGQPLATLQESSETDARRRAAIAWLANLARLRFTLTTTDSAHACRAAERIESACLAGDIPPSPLAFGDAEIAAAMRLGNTRSEMADVEACLARLAEAAGDTPLSPGWRR